MSEDSVVNTATLLCSKDASNNDNDDGNDGDDGDDGTDDDYDSLMMNVPLLEFPGQVPAKKLEAPPEGMSWKETAILECMGLALTSHDDRTPSEFAWKSPRDEECADSIMHWIPKRLSLPLWAIDPCSVVLAPDSIPTAEKPNDEAKPSPDPL
jgi:hypothetical protein